MIQQSALDLLASTGQSGGEESIPMWKLIVGGFCAWISFVLIGCIWIRHQSASVVKKLFWSLVVLLPPLGWMLYFGFFRPPSRTGYETPDSVDIGGA